MSTKENTEVLRVYLKNGKTVVVPLSFYSPNDYLTIKGFMDMNKEQFGDTVFLDIRSVMQEGDVADSVFINVDEISHITMGDDW